MAYSNTKRDKRQLVGIKMLKQVVWVGGLLMIILSSGYNISRQWRILEQARQRNEKLTNDVKLLKEDTRELEIKLREATDSANIARKQHEYLGLGSENDYWLILPEESSAEIAMTPTNEEMPIPNVLKWWRLFVK